MVEWLADLITRKRIVGPAEIIARHAVMLAALITHVVMGQTLVEAAAIATGMMADSFDLANAGMPTAGSTGTIIAACTPADSPLIAVGMAGIIPPHRHSATLTGKSRCGNFMGQVTTSRRQAARRSAGSSN